MNKIEALRTAAKAIREGHHYDWKKPHSCNCGIVAQVLMKKDVAGLRVEIQKTICAAKSAGTDGVTWQELSSVLCPITGIPTDAIFRALYDAGFDRKEICNLEGLADIEVCRRAGITRHGRRDEIKETVKTGWFSREEVVKQEAVHAHFEKASNAAAYMEAWADMLEENEIEPQLKEAADRLMAKQP